MGVGGSGKITHSVHMFYRVYQNECGSISKNSPGARRFDQATIIKIVFEHHEDTLCSAPLSRDNFVKVLGRKGAVTQQCGR